MTLNDLTLLYSGLANDGLVRPLKWEVEQKSDDYSRQIMTSAAAQKLTQILRQSPTPDGHVPAWLVKGAPSIAYKTGTSYGFRDAWAAGFSQEWTIVVWIGRADGVPRQGQTGRLAAAPLLFELFAMLPHDNSVHIPFQRDENVPDGLQKLETLAETGPQFIFPQNGVELWVEEWSQASSGFSLSALGEGELDYYVDGRPVPRLGKKAIWVPESPGFYTLNAVDELGRKTSANVRVKGPS